MKKVQTLRFVLVCTLIFLVSCSGNRTQDKPLNIILMIGDGMGACHVFAGMASSAVPLNLERCTSTGFQETYSASSDITDSGASATALATGHKTSNGAIGVDPEGNPLPNIVELARSAGLSTGIIATSTITHATPACFAAHNIKRGNYEEIAGDISRSGVDFILGGGWSHFRNREDGQNLMDSMAVRGYFVAGRAGDRLEENLKAGRKENGIADEANNPLSRLLSSVPAESPVIILSDSMAMPSILEGRNGILADATSAALERLSRDDDGFFLMVEGSQIDWEAHDNNLEGVVDEVLDFDLAIGRALDFAEKNTRTLVIVTADHETGGLVILEGGTANRRFTDAEPTSEAFTEIDSSQLRVAGKFNTKGHTGVMVPVYTYGPGAGVFGGIYENTAIFEKMKTLLEL